jgi:hypothetical protein
VKLLVVTPEPVDANLLRSTLDDDVERLPADRIVIFSHIGEKDYREDAGLADAEERFGVPVTHAEIAR